MVTETSTLLEDLTDPIGIWNNLKPQTVYYPASDLWLTIVVTIAMTIIHVLLDKGFKPKAEAFANQTILQNQITRPKWIPSKMTALTYDKLQWLNPKSFRKIVPKKYEQFSSSQQKELIEFQKACAKHSKQISKYQEALFKVVVFGVIYCYGLSLIFTDAPWFWDQELMWAQGWPQSMGDHPIFNLRIYYHLHIGYAAHRGTYQFFEHTRRDFWAMFIHHWVTVSLMVGSYMVGGCQIGATVLLCNDNCDLFMPIAKLASYGGYRKIEVVFTTAFLVLWIPLRIGVYFYKVLWSCMSHYLIWKAYWAYWACLAGLWVIYSLQFFWTKYLMELIFQKLMKGKGVTDVRSDDEGKLNKKQ